MPDRIIEAQAIISAKDATGDTFINIARKLQEVGKGAKASAEVERLSAALSQADATAKKIDGFRVASRSLDAAGISMAQARQKAAQLAEQIAGMTKPTVTLNGQMSQAEKAVVRATDAFKKQGQAVREARSALADAGVPINRLGEEQKRLKSVVESTTVALERQVTVERQAAAMAEKVVAAAHEQAKAEAAAGRLAHREAELRAEGIRRNGVGHLVAGTAAGYVSAHGVVHLGGEVMAAGSELQRARLASSQAGIPDDERAHIEQRALELSTRFGNVSQVGVMELAKELRSVVTHPEELDKVLTPLVQAKSVLDAKDLTGESSHGLNLLVRGAESIGAAQDPERLTRLIDAYVKAIQVMGTTINPDQIYQFDKYAKTAGATMSDRFLMTTGLSLSQEMGGSTAANDIFHAQKSIVGGFQNKHTPLREMVRLGLIDRDDVDFAKGSGEAKGLKPGSKGVHDAALAQTDLDLWVYKTLLPALEKNGITGTQAQLAEVNKIFTGGESDVISKFITQRSAFETHALAFPKASGLAATDQNAQDAAVGLQSLNKAIENLAANVSVSAMAPIGTALTSLAGQVDRLAQAAKDHPEIALAAGTAAGAGALAGSGALAYYVSTGFGLPAAAGRLTTAAEMLIGAAEKQGVTPGGGPGGKGSGPGGFLTSFLAMITGAEIASSMNAVPAPKTYDLRGALNFAEPHLGNFFLGPESPTADRDARVLRTERQRLGRDPLETGQDRLRDEMLRPTRPGEVFGPNLPAASHPSDDDRQTRARASDAASWLDELGRKERESVWQFGALTDKTGVVLTSFDGLNTRADTLTTGLGSAQHELDVLALAARSASTAFAGLISAAVGGGGSGLTNASWGGGAPNLSGADRRGGPAIGHVFSAAEREANIRSHAASIGIEPRVAMAVARSEGFGRFDGDRGTSFGDLQMHIGGGLGDTFRRATGKNPADPHNELELDRFALDQAKKGGWGPWHGAARIGVHGRYGIHDGPLQSEHPALAPPPSRRRSPGEHDGPSSHAVTAKLDRVAEKLERVAAAVERGGLHRFEVKADKSLQVQKTYQRGSLGPSMNGWG